MPEPIEYQILTNLQAALQAIAVSGGYHYDVAATAVRLDPNVNVETLIGDQKLRPFVLLDVQPETWAYEPAEQLRMLLPVTIHWVSKATEVTDAIRIQTFFRGCADVERAIAKDPARGGKATETRIVKRLLFPDDGAQVWASIETEIWLHRTYGQPDA